MDCQLKEPGNKVVVLNKADWFLPQEWGEVVEVKVEFHDCLSCKGMGGELVNIYQLYGDILLVSAMSKASCVIQDDKFQVR